ncbi:MAG: 50S ribosomal protein L18 [Candidatus Kapaibacteriales bacterium]
MERLKLKKIRRERRKLRIRKKIFGTALTPRLSIYRSLNHIYAQIIDDEKGHTLVACSTLDPDVRSLRNEKATKTEVARLVGKILAQKAIAKGIQKVAFDRNGFLYHGRIKALAEGAREGGLKF